MAEQRKRWRVRDAQKRRVYAAEDSLPKQSVPFGALRSAREALTPGELQAFVDGIVAGPLWRRLCEAYRAGGWVPSATVTVSVEPCGKRTAGSAVPYHNAPDTYGRIKVDPAHTTRLLVLHELAHLAASERGQQSHGWQFCAVFLTLCREVLGATVAELLVAAFKRERVRYREPRRQKLSPARRAELRERGRQLAAKRYAGKRRSTMSKRGITLRMLRVLADVCRYGRVDGTVEYDDAANWRSIAALERRGLVDVRWAFYRERVNYATVALTDLGRSVLWRIATEEGIVSAGGTVRGEARPASEPEPLGVPERTVAAVERRAWAKHRERVAQWRAARASAHNTEES